MPTKIKMFPEKKLPPKNPKTLRKREKIRKNRKKENVR